MDTHIEAHSWEKLSWNATKKDKGKQGKDQKKSRGTDVIQNLSRGFLITATVRDDHPEIFEMLLKAGAS
ncbi:hypothetical protein Tco_1476952 [Tanacetum coccineum]